MTALRLARRSIKRNLARSVLVIVLIALPVAGFTVADGLVRTMTDRDVDVDRVMGTADLMVSVNGQEAFDVESLLPKGSRAVPIGANYGEGSLRLTDGDRLVRTMFDVVVVGDPLTRHRARLSAGRLPDSPDEVLLTTPLAERLGLLDGAQLRQGATVVTTNGPRAAVTGLADNPYEPQRQAVVALPGSVLENALRDGPLPPRGYLIDLPDDVDVRAFAEEWPVNRSTVSASESYEDRMMIGDYLRDTMGGPIALFAGLGLLGIVLTAGAAFAVGARRQARELGLVAANGGTARHVRRIVLAQGLVLGVLGAATGLVLGAAVTVLGVPLWRRVLEHPLDDLRFGWVELTIAAGVGVLASMLASVVPAFGVARMSPVDALAGRSRAAGPRVRLPRLGVSLVLAGVACVVAAGMLGQHRLLEVQKLSWGSTNYVALLDKTLPIGGILLGAVLALGGLVLVMPALAAGIGRFGGRLPLSGRLAVRDAVRNRRRTMAGVAAIVVSVAGSVAAAFVFTGQADNAPRRLPDNVVLAQLDPVSRDLDDGYGQQELDQAATGMTAAVPGAVAHEVTTVTGSPAEDLVVEPVYVGPTGASDSSNYARLGIGTPEQIELSTGRAPDAGMRSALAAGRVVVFGEPVVGPAGTVQIYNLGDPVELPAYDAGSEWSVDYSPYRFLPAAFISAEAAADLGGAPYVDSVAVTHPPSTDVEALRVAAEDAGVVLVVEEPVADQVTSLYLMLWGVAALVALLGAGVTVGLSATEGRSDLATLAALGAQPRRRRTLAGAQALVITGLGTFAGLLLGCCVGYAATPVAGVLALAVPWQHLWLTAVCVPLLAVTVAMVVTPSRLPLIVRRQS